MAGSEPPRLDEMNEQEAFEFMERLLSSLSAEEEYALRHEDYSLELPQSGERIRGRDNMLAFQRAFPTPPQARLRRVLVRPGLWIMEGFLDYGQSSSYVVSIIELRDGKFFRDTRYYGEPFEPPAWRAQWVEKIED